MDETDYIWQCEIDINDIECYERLSIQDRFTVHLGGESYSLIVDSKNRSRSRSSTSDDVALSMQIKGVSPIALLGSPYASVISNTFSTARTARSIVEELLGETVTWEIIDWIIPPYRMSFEKVTPVEAAKMVTDAAGALIESDRDGSIRVRYKYPVSTELYDSVESVQIFTDTEHIYSSVDGDVYVTVLNKYRVRESSGTFGDTIEWIPDEVLPDIGIAKVFPSPFRDSFTLTNNLQSAVIMEDLGFVVDTIVDEDIEFIDGVANIKYPIISMTSISWYTDSLGSVAYTPRSRSLSAQIGINFGYALACISYTTESRQYRISASCGTKVQLLVTDG